MMKINLSDENGDENGEDQSEQTIAEPTPTEEVTLSEEIPEEPEVEIAETKSTGKKRQILLLVLLLVVAVAAAGYFYKDLILSYFPSESQVIEPAVPPPPPPPPQPEVEIVESEPDPAFVAMNRIGETVTPRLWLTSAIIKYDGTYRIRGMAFSHKSMTDMVSLLQERGTVTSKSIPGKSKSAEKVYPFSIEGTLNDLDIPEFLDPIPTDALVAAAETVRSREKELGVKFLHLPKSGATYTDKDMPFTLEGSYEGLKNTIGFLCPEDGDIRVSNLTIAPSSPGRSFDKIRASFSLQTVSPI